MSQMNISPEEIQAAIEAMAGGNFMNMGVHPAAAEIEKVTADGVVNNVTRLPNGQMRCIVSSDGVIKPTTITDEGATQQTYNSETDTIAWLTYLDNERGILLQDKEGIRSVDSADFKGLFGDMSGYALSYLSSFNGNNNVLLDEYKVTRYKEATQYIDGVIGDLNDDLKTLLTGMCVNTPDFENICQTWDQAAVYDVTENDVKIEWGCAVETEEEYTKFDTKYVILWARPMISGEEERAPDALIQLVTRQVNPGNVPSLGQDSKATFMVEETINSQIAGYAVVSEDTLNGHLVGIDLYKSVDFDLADLSF